MEEKSLNIEEKTARQVGLIRYYLEQSSKNLGIEEEPATFPAINLLHEAFEATLFSCADFLNIRTTERTSIHDYVEKIEEKLDGRAVPFRARILQFNRARVSAKHALTLPSDRDLRTFFEIVPEFIRSIIQTVFGYDIDDILLSNLIKDQEVRSYIDQAVMHRSDGLFFESLVEVRKVIYTLVENRFDVRIFEGRDDRDVFGLLDERARCEAPQYARSDRYIKKHVLNPFDYIVLDHSKIDAELLKNGIDTHQFWNVWRITPKIYKNSEGEWLVCRELDVLMNSEIAKDCTYAIDAVISIVLSKQTAEGKFRRGGSEIKSIGVSSGATIYHKASVESEIVGCLPEDVDRVNVTLLTPSMDGKENFWLALYIRRGGPILFGYIRMADTCGDFGEPIVPFDDREEE